MKRTSDIAGDIASLPSPGLGDLEAAARLKAEGPNELPRSGQRPLLRIMLDVAREPMLLLLLAGGAIYVVLGDLGEALVLLTFACLSIFIAIVQESRTERVLEALRDLSSPRALVVRQNRRIRIPGREVVRGDVLALGEGDRVPADAHLLQARDLLADESLLTGESEPVRKRARHDPHAKPAARPGGDDLPIVFAGSLIVRGDALAETFATGPRSAIGKVGISLEAMEREPPRLQAQTRRLVRIFAVLGTAVSLLAVLLYGLRQDDWLQAGLGGIALGMAMLPEEFPVVLAVFMAMGAWRISQARVLTRRAAAIETLGAATVLCTDKTGTLTQNHMRVAQMRRADGQLLRIEDNGAPDAFHDLIEIARLASAQSPVDPMERAFHELAQHELAQQIEALQQWTLVRSYGLRPDLPAMSQAWKRQADSGFLVACKGAPEAIANLCRLEETARADMKAAVETMTAGGLRVLGLARTHRPDENFPARQQDFAFEFLGLAALADPLRAQVPDAVRECRSAGIAVVMITGDHPGTAKAIAAQAGIESHKVIAGEALASMSADELAAHAGCGAVFARILPEQKLRIVEALKARGEIVAMTGDGVNDAPSLKAAHIGIAMGGRGADVAREAAGMVLLDDDFSSIVKAIRLGRRIYDNLRKAMGFVFAAHVPIAGLTLLPLAFGLPILLAPVHIALLQMVIDPVCSLVFEAQDEEPDVMSRPPRDPQEPLFSWGLVTWGLAQGALAFALVAALYLAALQRDMPLDEARTLAFFSLATGIVALTFANRSFSASLASAFRRPGPALIATLLGVPSLLGLLLAWPAARALFGFVPLHWHDVAIVLAVGAVLLGILEAVKMGVGSRQ